MSSYVADHPGGDIILKHAGKDATRYFNNVSAHAIVKGLIQNILCKTYIGECKIDGYS